MFFSLLGAYSANIAEAQERECFTSCLCSLLATEVALMPVAGGDGVRPGTSISNIYEPGLGITRLPAAM